MGALQRRGIPFVIRRLSILSSTLVRDLLAWLRLIGQPADNIACARVLAAPHWGLEPRDLVRLAERADKNHRRPLSEEIESAQNEPSFARLKDLVALVHRLRKSSYQKNTSELLDETHCRSPDCAFALRSRSLLPRPVRRLRARLGTETTFWGCLESWGCGSWACRGFRIFIAPREKIRGSEGVRVCVRRPWAEFRTEESKRLRDFLEYLYYFNEARGEITLEDQPSDDAVELMTVHSAKGLEFPHVFVLRLSKQDFPCYARKLVFEFPPELMKEEKPEGDFHIQEERRLFYVALTRARQRLTLSTVINKRKKQSQFSGRFSGGREGKDARRAATLAESRRAASRRSRRAGSRFG